MTYFGPLVAARSPSASVTRGTLECNKELFTEYNDEEADGQKHRHIFTWSNNLTFQVRKLIAMNRYIMNYNKVTDRRKQRK